MESGINADQNFYSRLSPERNQPPQRNYDPPPLPEFESRSPQLPPKLPFLTTQNLQAATANGFVISAVTGVGDPDEFYREYRGVQQSTNGYTDVTTNGMPATASDSRQMPSSLRSNGNGSTPKHPPLPGARNNLKPSYRSASSPLDERTALGGAKSTSALNGLSTSRNQPSVKDLLRRFDQNNEQPSSSARKPVPRLVTKDLNGPGYMRDRVGYQARSAPNNQNTTARAGTSTREPGPSRVKSPPTKTTQRTRFATEDQHSNNTLSGTPRATRPRNLVSGNISQASKSMTNLSPTTANPPSQFLPPVPLFGEVVSQDNGGSGIAYGIPRTAARRTSESSLHPSWIHQRGISGGDIDPSSPSSWYRGVTPRLEDINAQNLPSSSSAQNPPRFSPGHNRNHSDMADTKVNAINHIMPTFNTTAPTPTTPHQASRLPIASNRYSGSSESSSQSSRRSSRANSPTAARNGSNGHLRKPQQSPWSPAGRSTPPTNRSHTPTRGTARGRAKTPEKIPINTARLNAYVSAPPPKLSPSLRSSRPRQPVSSASTASSRQKAADRSGSPQQVRTGMKITRTGGIDHEKPKKAPERVIDVGPVDFAARREKIQRAYTKSIHESEQKEIRAANLRRLNERRARDSTAAPEKDADGGQAAKTPTVETPLEPIPNLPEPLHINTSFSSPIRNQNGNHAAESQDSPTLGMPGTFVDDDEPPPSAISNVTGTTDIENEPQTEAPRLSRMVSSQRLEPMMISSQVFFEEDQFSPEQALFGIANNNDDESIKIMLDATPVEELQPEVTPTNDLFSRDRDPSPPGAFEEDDYTEYNQLVFSSTVTDASPKDTTPIHSRPATPLESNEHAMKEQFLNVQHDRHNDEPPLAPEILYPEQLGSTKESEAEETKLHLPTLRTALAPSILVMNGNVQDSLNTPITDIEYESSDGLGGANNSEQESYGFSNSNGDLRTPSPNYRTSHQSSWTDDSVRSADEYSGQEEYSQVPPVTISSEPEPEKKPTPPPKEGSAISPIVPPKPDGYSPQPSPLFAPSSTRLSSPNRHQLPPLSTGGGFGLDLDDPSSNIASVTPLWPEYAPPPPPVSSQQGDSSSLRSPPPPSLYNRRPPSSLYHTSQNDGGRTIESRRASDDVYSPRASLSTPRSSTQISLEDITLGQSFDSKNTAPVATEGSEPVQKEDDPETKRLRHRRQLIKELIDTESIYSKDMNVVEEIYKGTAEACPKLDTNDINIIFRNTAQIVAFSTMFLDELKSAGSSVYSPRQKIRGVSANTAPTSPATEDRLSVAATLAEETDDQKDRKTFVGANFAKHLTKMQDVYTDYLKNSELASARLTVLQNDSAVKVWLSECNLVAKDLTAAWNLDALLVKPVQRITRYQLLVREIYEATPEDHPDYHALRTARLEIGSVLSNINDYKRRVEMVGKIVGRKRKESDVRTGIAKAFGRRTDKLQSNANRPPDDEVYVKLHEKFGDDYLRLQVVLRDVEFYTRQCSTYVNDFLRYLSSMELIMRMSASPYPELESKWARFNMSMRDMGTIALEDHINSVRQKVIEPFESVIQLYGPPGLAMKKRSKRRLDYERWNATKVSSRDVKLFTLVEQYEALNETLKLELPKLSTMTETIGKICLIQFVNIQTQWYSIWQEKVRIVLEESQMPKDIEDIVDMFSRDYKYVEARAQELGIVNGSFDSAARTRESQSTQDDDSSSRTKWRPSNLSTRSRGLSLTSDKSPSLPTPDFVKRNSGQFTFSPIVANTPGLSQVSYPYQSYSTGHSRAGSGSPATPDPVSAPRQYASNLARPSTSRSYTSDNGVPRLSADYNPQHRRESSSTYNSASYHQDGPPPSTRPYSGLFNSALPDGPDEVQRSSRTSSRDRNVGNRFNVLYLAASLFEFNISATKSEAGYPYLTYQAGEIFDVIGEKGELWLAKNQDDPREVVGWIWSKHFARLATD